MKILQKITTALLVITLFNSCTTAEDEVNTTKVSCDNTCEYTIEANQTPGTVPSSIEGTHVLTFSKDTNSTNSYYENGVKGSFTISNNTLTITVEGKECVTLINPIESSAVEFTFINSCGTNFAYAISADTDGNLNEINLLNRNGTRFFGQFN